MEYYKIPVDYEGLNGYNSMRSVPGLVENDYNTQYFMRSLFQRAISGTTFRLPRAWEQGKRYFKNVLYSLGYIGVIKTAKFGVIPQICGFNGYGLFLQPTEIIVNNAHVENFTGKIGKDCELIMLCGDYMGVLDICEHYAIRLSTAITSLDVAFMNERIPFMAAAKNKAAAETLKALYEKVSAGESFIVYDKFIKGEGLDGSEDPIWKVQQDVGNNYISDKLLADMDSIIRQFDREIGILAVGDKKERMITDEVAAFNDDAVARSSTWFENLSDSFDRVNALFPELNLSFSMRYGGQTVEYTNNSNVDRNL